MNPFQRALNWHVILSLKIVMPYWTEHYMHLLLGTLEYGVESEIAASTEKVS